MGGTQVLKSFMVALGFRVNAQSLRGFNSAVSGASLNVMALANRAAFAAIAVGGAVTAIASNMERLFYSSRRTDVAVDSLQAFQFGMSQIGFSTENAEAMLEKFRITMMDPGMQSMLAQFGIKAGDAKEQLQELIGYLQKRYPGESLRYMRNMIADMFGIGPMDLKMLEAGKGTAAVEESFRRRLQRESGVDADALAEKSNKFMSNLRRSGALVNVIGQQIADEWLGPMTEFVEKFNSFLERFNKLAGKFGFRSAWDDATGSGSGVASSIFNFVKGDFASSPIARAIESFNEWGRELGRGQNPYGFNVADMSMFQPQYGLASDIGGGPSIYLTYDTTISGISDPDKAAASFRNVMQIGTDDMVRMLKGTTR